MTNNTAVWVLGVISAILAIAYVLLASAPAQVITQEKIQFVDKPVVVTDNTTNAKLDQLLADDNFETTALELAKADLNAKGYKDLYNAMVDNNVQIDVKGDISKVVVTDSDVTGADKKEGNAHVSLDLKVYFEDLSGDDKKIYVTADYTIKDNEVDSVTYTFN